MNLSTSGLPVHHQLLEFTQTHVLSQWCHPTISSSVIPFSSCPQFFPASGSFPMSQLFTSGGQSVGVLASTSVLPASFPLFAPNPGSSSLSFFWILFLEICPKSQYSHQRNLPFLPGQSICACRFIHKYRLNTLCVATGPAPWQISESIRHSSGFVVLIIVLER